MIGYLLLVVGPVMLAALTMLFIDRHFDGVFFDSGEGGAPLLYEHLAWIFFTGAYADRCSCSPRGAISEIFPTFARKPLFSRATAMAAMARDRRARARSPGCRTCTRRRSRSASRLFAMVIALALVVPIGLLIFNWIATLWAGRHHHSRPAAVRARRDQRRWPSGSPAS